MQTRAARVNDVLSDREVNEIADSPAGVTRDAVKGLEHESQADKDEFKKAAEEAVSEAKAPGIPQRSAEQLMQEIRGTKQSLATVRKDGKVEFEKPEGQSST